MQELIIDNVNVELGENKLVFFKSAYSFEDWLQKTIGASERVTLPRTSKLDTIYYRPSDPSIIGNKFNQYRKFKYKDYGKIVYSGICKLLGLNVNKEYELQLLDDSFSLFENMKNELNKVDFESSDFVFNATSYGTLKLLNISVWIWPASSMHEDKVLSKNILNANYSFSRPFFSVKRLLEAFFSENGYTYELSTNAELLDKLIISANSAFVFTSFEKSFSGDLVVAGSQVLDISTPDFLKTDTISGTTILQLTYKSKIRFRGTIKADSDYILKITGTSSAATDSQTQTFIINNGTFHYDLTSNEFDTADPTYDLTFTFVGTGTITFTDFLIYTIIDENDFGNVSAANFIDFKVKTYDNLPEITQINLFKHALVLIGGFFTTDNFSKKIQINSLNELSKMGAYNWSSKFIEDSEEIIPITDYGKINYFNYNNSDNNPANLGRGSFEIDDETLPDIENKYDSIFAASQEVTITDVMIDNTVYDDTERINDINTLIGYYEEVLTYTVARFENLTGNTVLNNYYTNFIAAIQQGLVFEASFNINKSDYFLFDFTKLIYIKQKKSTFYCLGISEFMEGRPTKLMLLKA